MSNAPFKIGDRVAAIGNIGDGVAVVIKKGQHFTVLGLKLCDCCDTWYIDIGLEKITNTFRTVCFYCRQPVITYIMLAVAKSFRLIQPVSQSCIVEIAIENQVAETLDIPQLQPA